MATSRRGCRPRCCRGRGGIACADALFAATRHWQVALHFNKGLAGASPLRAAAAETRRRIRRCSMRSRWSSPRVKGRLRIPVLPAMSRTVAAREARRSIAEHGRTAQGRAQRGSYVSESNFFEPKAGSNPSGAPTTRLLAREGEVRSRGPVLRPPRRRQRTLERRRFHAVEVRRPQSGRSGRSWPIQRRQGCMVTEPDARGPAANAIAFLNSINP